MIKTKQTDFFIHLADEEQTSFKFSTTIQENGKRLVQMIMFYDGFIEDDSRSIELEDGQSKLPAYKSLLEDLSSFRRKVVAQFSMHMSEYEKNLNSDKIYLVAQEALAELANF